MQGWRMKMEDAHIAFLNMGQNEKTHVFGVFDGHCGKEVSQFVKAHLCEELVAHKNFNNNLKGALVDTFFKMDELMLERKGKIELWDYNRLSKEEDYIIKQWEKDNENPTRSDEVDVIERKRDDSYDDNCKSLAMEVGCTSCVVVIDEKDKKIYCANAGDSRAILCKKDIAIAISTDHKPFLDVEKKRIEKAGGTINSDGRVNGKVLLNLGNLNLCRALGDLQYKQNKELSAAEQIITACPDVTIENLHDVNFVVLACDGIWDCMTNQQVCDFITERLKANKSLTDIMEEIMDKCLAPTVNFFGKLLIYNHR
jgi:protein phosphatase 1G